MRRSRLRKGQVYSLSLPFSLRKPEEKGPFSSPPPPSPVAQEWSARFFLFLFRESRAAAFFLLSDILLAHRLEYKIRSAPFFSSVVFEISSRRKTVFFCRRRCARTPKVTIFFPFLLSPFSLSHCQTFCSPSSEMPCLFSGGSRIHGPSPLLSSWSVREIGIPPFFPDSAQASSIGNDPFLSLASAAMRPGKDALCARARTRPFFSSIGNVRGIAILPIFPPSPRW